MKSDKISTRYFPFAPGIPYKIKNGRYVLPQMGGKYLSEVLSHEEIVVSAYCGLFESLFSFSILEMINQLSHNKTLYWCGNYDFSQLTYLNGLAQSKNLISSDKLSKYPVPIFFDASNRTYFNCLVNYINGYTYYGEYKYTDKKSVALQLFRNSMIEWDPRYLPQMRNLIESSEFKEWSAAHHFRAKKPFILLIDGGTGLSQHDDKFLNWGIHEVRSFSSMLRAANISLVILTKYPQRHPGVQAYFPPFKLDNALYLISKASTVLSVEPDWLLSTLLIGSGSIICNVKKGALEIEKNARYLKSKNKIVSLENVDPLKAFEVIK